jgi:hypothetical protein
LFEVLSDKKNKIPGEKDFSGLYFRKKRKVLRIDCNGEIINIPETCAEKFLLMLMGAGWRV